MIHIKIDDKNPPEEWCQKADRLTIELKELATDDERKDFINRHRAIWVELNEWLRGLSHNKCWYSEAKEIYSFYDVDHFRPKNRAKELDGTMRAAGYWWLVFDWRNYRLCGNIGNRPNTGEEGTTRGKGDYFPLKEGSPVACSPEHDLNDEIYYLLDPTDPDDPPLLTFDISGFPKPAVADGTWEFKRVTETIRILHLDYGPLVDARKVIWYECTSLMNQIQNEMLKENNNISVTTKNRIKNFQKQLRKMTSPSSELSATAKACLLNSGHVWARNLISN